MAAISLPKALLPCFDDYARLLVIADFVEESGDEALSKHLRWTAREWEWGRGLARAEIQVGMPVFARYSSQGWSRAIVINVTAKHIEVAFPHRRGLGSHVVLPPAVPMTGQERRIVLQQRAHRAWWDLEPRGQYFGKHYKRPKPRKGYGTMKNAALAAALMGAPIVVPRKKPEDLTPLMFAE